MHLSQLCVENPRGSYPYKESHRALTLPDSSAAAVGSKEHFPSEFVQFMAEVSTNGISAMELVQFFVVWGFLLFFLGGKGPQCQVSLTKHIRISTENSPRFSRKFKH